MKEVRTAIVGMGIGRVNGSAIAKDPRGRVVALCDIAEERMASFAKELPGPVTCYTDYRKMCRDREIDAVFVGTPNQSHVPIALEAVRRGKHVLITKPLADRAAPARRLVEAAEAAGVVNMMSLSTRFSGEAAYLGRMAQRGELGELYYARARSIRRSGIPDWSLGFIEVGGGAFRDMGVHVLDAAWWLLGMPAPVSVTGVAGAKFGPRGLGYWDFRRPARKFYRRYVADDYAGGFIRFANGAALSLECSFMLNQGPKTDARIDLFGTQAGAKWPDAQVESFWASHQPEEFQIELFGTEAGALFDPLTIYRTAGGAPQDVSVKLPRGPEPWDRIAAHFIACILDGESCTAPLRHGLQVQEMMEAMLASAASGREVRLPAPRAPRRPAAAGDRRTGEGGREPGGGADSRDPGAAKALHRGRA